jgi:hypothetical protein
MKNRLLGRSLIVLVFAVIALTLGGCPGEDNDDMTGGGWIGTGKNKINFGFNFKCKTDDNGNAKASGQLQYNDRENGVRFHGVADSLGDGECNGLLDTYEGSYYGTYTPQPRGEGGTFKITVVDGGKKGPSKGDTLTLELFHDGADEAWYTKSATLAGGNIQAHGDKVRE